MVKTKTWRLTAFLAGLLLLLSAALLCSALEDWELPSTAAVAAEAVPELGQPTHREVLPYLTFRQEPVAFARDSGTIFVTLNPGDYDSPQALAEEFRMPGTDWQLWLLGLAPDLQRQIREGKPCELIVADPERNYVRFPVVLTTLPVLQMEGEALAVPDPERPAFRGSLQLWSAEGEMISSDAVRNVRGGIAAHESKRPWKLELVKKSGKKHSENLLGLGYEDDWILNPMSMDDTKLREHLFMALWNRAAQENDHMSPMSTGRYVEVILEGEYQGIYSLQRRIDPKYLELGPWDILLKGKRVQLADSAEEGYEIKFAPIPSDEVYALMDDFRNGKNNALMDRENLVMTNLFIMFTGAGDNVNYKNMFYILRREGESYRMELLPWDTDLTLGIVWKDDLGVAYDNTILFDEDACRYYHRMEYCWLAPGDPELNTMLARQWQTLRQGLMTEKTIGEILDSLDAQVTGSGARVRDFEKWGLYHAGEDTAEKLRQIIADKLVQMDRMVLDPQYS